MDKSYRPNSTPKGKEYCDRPGTSCFYGPDNLCANCGRKRGWRYALRPRKGGYGNKTIYVRDISKWDRAMKLAQSQGISISALIEFALDRLLEPDSVAQDKLQRIAAIIMEKE